jgi:hypothetical protein
LLVQQVRGELEILQEIDRPAGILIDVTVGARRVLSTTPPLSECVRVVSPHLGALATERARSSVRRLARSVPSSDLAGFECALGHAAPRLDLIVRLPRTLADFASAHEDDPVWRRIAVLSRRLHQRSPSLEGVNVMGLEFDVPLVDAAPVRSPALFFELDREADLAAPQLVRLTSQLLGNSLAADCAALLGKCLSVLPARSAPFQLGAMLSRPSQAVRLVVSDMPPDELARYLRDIGWIGDNEPLTAAMSALADRAESFALSMDLAHSVHRRIGIECYVAGGPSFVDQWRLLLEGLVERGLCTSAQADALLAWNGVSQENSCPDTWPRHLRWGDRLLASRAISVIARTLGHVKLVVEPGLPMQAKAYLGFAHYWLDRRAAKQAPHVTA